LATCRRRLRALPLAQRLRVQLAAVLFKAQHFEHQAVRSQSRNLSLPSAYLTSP